MIVPRSRLLWVVGLIVLPLLTLAAIAPTTARVAYAVVAGAAVVALLDAALAHGSFSGIGADWPEVARLTRNSEGQLELSLTDQRARPRRLRAALALPPEFICHQDELDVCWPEGAKSVRLTWACTPTRRGRYRTGRLHLETPSPLGLWGGRKAFPAETEIRVYPTLLPERKNLAALFLFRGSFGIHAHRQIGQGREFEKLREYMPGDGYEQIHWKATAKRGRPVTKVFQLERTQEVYVIIDSSRLSARPPAGAAAAPGQPADPALERFITAGLILAIAAGRQGDLFGLVTFSDGVDGFLPARSGGAHFRACRDTLYTLGPSIVSPDFGELCSFIRLRLRKRALLVFLTSLDDPVLAESFVRHVGLICRQHLIVVNMLTAPGVRPIFTGPEVASVGDLYSGLGGHIQWQRLGELAKVLKRHGVDCFQWDSAELCLQLVSQYVNIKRRQLL